MPIIELRHSPDLNISRLEEGLRTQFQGKYEVYSTFRRQTRRQIAFHGIQKVVIVRKNWFCGAFVLLEQRPNETRVKIWSDPPSDDFFKILPLVFPLLIIVLPVMKILSYPIVQNVQSSLKQFQQA